MGWFFGRPKGSSNDDSLIKAVQTAQDDAAVIEAIETFLASPTNHANKNPNSNPKSSNSPIDGLTLNNPSGFPSPVPTPVATEEPSPVPTPPVATEDLECEYTPEESGYYEDFVTVPHTTKDDDFVRDTVPSTDEGFVHDTVPTTDESFVSDVVSSADESLVDVNVPSTDEDFILSRAIPSPVEVQQAFSVLQQYVEISTSVGAPHEKYDMESRNNFGGGELMALQSTTNSVSSVQSERDWCEPALNICNSTALHDGPGLDSVCNVFQLLRTSSYLKRAVISLASDQAVWDAVSNNEVIKELKDSDLDEETEEIEGENKGGIGRIVIKTREKIKRLIGKILMIVSELFQNAIVERVPTSSIDNTSEPKIKTFEQKKRTSLFLAFVVILIVMVSRIRRARA